MSLTRIKRGIAKISNKYNTALAALSVAILTPIQAIAGAARSTQYDFGNLVDNGKSIDDVAQNAENALTTVFNVIKALGVLVGLVLVFTGVMRLKKSQDPNSGTSPMQGILLIIFGGLCAVLPWLLITSATTVQG